MILMSDEKPELSHDVSAFHPPQWRIDPPSSDSRDNYLHFGFSPAPNHFSFSAWLNSCFLLIGWIQTKISFTILAWFNMCQAMLSIIFSGSIFSVGK